LANALLTQGKLDEAIYHFRRALQAEPNYLAPLDSMAHILATHPDPNMRTAGEAVRLAERAAKLTGHRNAAILNTLAEAYAAAGRFDKAITVAEAALALASNQQNENLVDKIRHRLELYRQKKPYRELIPHQDTQSP
jgi:spermidine synthase